MKAMEKHRNVLAVYSLDTYTCRDHFAGVLDEMSNKSNWSLSMAMPESFRSEQDLKGRDGMPYDGIILSVPGTDDIMKKLAATKIPTVLVNITDKRLSARSDAVAAVWTDNAEIGIAAARHLMERGEYASAGYVYEPLEEFYSAERLVAFRAEMKKAGIKTFVFPENADKVKRGASTLKKTGSNRHVPPADFYDGLGEWLRKLPKPAAVMAAYDMTAAEVINACKSEGIPVPSSVSVAGVDYDVSCHAKCGMSISSVVLNMRMMGRLAVRELEFLFRHPNWKGRIHEILVPPKGMFVGESSSRSISAARLVDVALDYIARNRMRPLSSADVISHLGCSRQLASLRFSQIRGTTIGKEIERERMDEAQRRLDVGESVKDIVKAMHFTSANHFYRIYKRHFGHTIRQSQTS